MYVCPDWTVNRAWARRDRPVSLALCDRRARGHSFRTVEATGWPRCRSVPIPMAIADARSSGPRAGTWRFAGSPKCRSRGVGGGDLTAGSILVEDWFPYWMDRIARPRLRPNTIAAYSASIANHIIPAIGGRRIVELQASDIRWVYERMMSKGSSSTTARQAHHVMGSAFKTAVRERKIDFNPCDMVDAPRARVVNLEAPGVEEAIEFLRYCQSSPEGAMWATAVLTGARRGEVLGLTRSRVSESLDFSWQLQSCVEDDRGRPVVPHGFEFEVVGRRVYLTSPKSRAGWRLVSLVEPLRTMIVRQMQSTAEHPHGLIFTCDGEAIRPDSMSYHWRKLRADAGSKKDLRPHDLGHPGAETGPLEERQSVRVRTKNIPVKRKASGFVRRPSADRVCPIHLSPVKR